MSEILAKIDSYVREIDYLLPYPKKHKEKVLEELKTDVTEAMKDSHETDPSVVFGSVREVALDLVKGENWQIQPASWSRRVGAYLIDLLIYGYTIGLLILLISMNLLISLLDPSYSFAFSVTALYEIYNYKFQATFFDIEIFILLTNIVGLMVVFPYFILLEYKFSCTIGKRLMGLIVIHESGLKMTFKQALIRNLSKTFLEIFFLFDIFLGKHKSKEKNQRLFDIAAETMVMQIKYSDWLI